jgi:hypothetical protein
VAGFLRRALVFELRLYVCLLRWVVRRPAVPRGAESIDYARAVTPVMGLWIFASAAEIPLLHVLLPWEAAQVVSLVLGAWGLFWMLGLLASFQVRPHLVGPAALRVRNGPVTDLGIAWADVRSVRMNRRDVPSSVRALQPRETEAGTDLQVVVNGQVNVEVVLRHPVTVRTHTGALEVTSVSFFADEPRETVARLRQHLAAVTTE